MTTRKNFDQNLIELKNILMEMAKDAKSMLTDSMEALKVQDQPKAKSVLEMDNKIDLAENVLNEKAILLIAKESPVATDLRKIIVALKISSEIERMGDMAVNVAKSVLHIGEEPHFKELIDIPKMMDIAIEMVDKSMEAFYHEDVVLAKETANRDDEVDDMYGQLIRELMTYISQYPHSIQQITQLSFVCRYIERVADHATNISENTIYLVTGKRYDLNM